MNSLISKITTLFPNDKVLYANGNHTVYCVNWYDISPNVKKWSRNRDVDETRVVEIVDTFKAGGHIPKMIHLAYLEDEGLVCYDGNNRRVAFNQLNSKMLPVIVDLMYPATPQSVFIAFENINKSVAVPALYLSESGTLKNEIIKLVEFYEIKYPLFVSASARCNRPHFNRDTFTDNIHEIYDRLQFKHTIAEIGLALDKLNTCYKNQQFDIKHANYSKNIITKCQKYNLWLFLERKIPAFHIVTLFESKI